MTNKFTDTSTRSRSTITVKQTSSNAIKNPIVPEAAMGNRPRWSAWQDWVNIALGAYLALSPLWVSGAPSGLFLTIGLLAIAVAIWAGFTASSTLAEFVQMVIGVTLILSPFFHAYSDAATDEATEITSAIGTAFFIGAGLIAMAAMAGHRNRSGRSATNPYDNEHT